MVAAKYFVGFVDGEAVCHIATAPRLEIGGMRACRMVVMPEWQGAGVGMRFLNEVCRLQFTEANPYHARTNAVYFHTGRRFQFIHGNDRAGHDFHDTRLDAEIRQLFFKDT